MFSKLIILRNSKINTALLIFCVSLIFFLFTNNVHAGTGLSIQPVKASYTLKPGESVTASILLTNQSDEAVNIDMKVEDFVPVAGGDTISFVGRAPGLTTVKDWVTLDKKTSFIFNKGESKQIPFTVKVPLNAEPGSHFGVAFFKATRVSELQAQLKIGTQVGMLIFITVPGNHLQSGKIVDFSAPRFLEQGPVPFIMKFENTGTVHFEPKGEVVVKNMFGKDIAHVPIEGEVVLPTGIKRIVSNWNVTGFLLGYYKAVANVRDGEGNLLSSQVTGFYVIPVWYILGFIAVLLLIYFLIKFIRRRVKISISLN
jgi:hypothetical protein